MNNYTEKDILGSPLWSQLSQELAYFTQKQLEELCLRVKNAVNRDPLSSITNTRLIEAFDWVETEEGFYFWSDISNGVIPPGLGEKIYNSYIGEEKEEDFKSQLTHQIGGSHYSSGVGVIQPVEFLYSNNVPFLEANVVKYAVRHKDKNGLEDLKKAVHYLQILMEFEYSVRSDFKVEDSEND